MYRLPFVIDQTKVTNKQKTNLNIQTNKQIYKHKQTFSLSFMNTMKGLVVVTVVLRLGVVVVVLLVVVGWEVVLRVVVGVGMDMATIRF